jgi:hypothetical protein
MDMTPDNFEQRLQRQTMRQIPIEWRNDILTAAHLLPPKPRPSPFALRPSWLSALLWPCPQAWVGLAAVWLLVLAFNFATRDKSETAVAQMPPASPQMIEALREQHRLLVELVGRTEPREADRPKTAVPAPRSERLAKWVMA